MDWAAPIDLYCERLVPGLWAEPVNALSNLGFIAVAIAILVVQRRSGRRDLFVTLLALLVLAIGVGSFLFHTFANRWSVLADVIPITLFIYFYLALALRRFLALGWLAAILMLLVFFGLTFPIEAALRPLLSGSAGYVPALLAMLVIGSLLAVRGHPAARYVMFAGMIFLVSLTLRTLDLPLCPAWPLGTHFLWHLLNATTLGILLFGALRHSSPRLESALHDR
jgi:hypothetical protein